MLTCTLAVSAADCDLRGWAKELREPGNVQHSTQRGLSNGVPSVGDDCSVMLREDLRCRVFSINMYMNG